MKCPTQCLCDHNNSPGMPGVIFCVWINFISAPLLLQRLTRNSQWLGICSLLSGASVWTRSLPVGTRAGSEAAPGSHDASDVTAPGRMRGRTRGLTETRPGRGERPRLRAQDTLTVTSSLRHHSARDVTHRGARGPAPTVTSGAGPCAVARRRARDPAPRGR